MIDVAKLGIEVESNGVVTATKRLDGMSKASTRAEAATERVTKRAEAMGRALGRAAVVAGAALSAMAVNSIRLAVAAEETASKFQVVFRGSVESVNNALIDLTDTVPLTLTEMRKLSAGVQDMLVPMGLAREEAAKFSVEAVRLAADIGSFNHVDPSIVLENIQSALAGSSEPMRKYGIDVRKTRLETIAYEHGLVRMGEELNQAAIAQATFIAITEDSADAMGDAARTVNSTANQMKLLRRDFIQAQEDLGDALIPAFAQFLNALNQVNDEGITPLQAGLRALSTLILNITQVVLMSVAGWKTLSTAAANAMLEVRIAIVDGLQQIAEDPAIVQAALRVAKLMGGPAAAAAVALQKSLTKSQKELAASATAARAQIEANNAALEESTDNIFDAVAAARAAIEDMRGEIDRSLEDTRSGMDGLVPAIESVIEPLREMNDLIADELRDNFAFLADMEFQGFADEIKKEIAALKGGADAWEAYQREMFQAQAVAELGADATDAQRQAIAELSGELFDAREAFGVVIDATVTFGDALNAYGSAFGDMFQSLQEGTERGSKAYKALELAVIATNMVQAIGAILNQAQGDPYSAPARMAVMAAIVSGLVGTAITLGSGGGGSADLSADRQARLGTGGVLGDPDAVSQSILRATEITADATSSLVNINTNMLRALDDLTVAIEGSAREVNNALGNLNFPALPGAGWAGGSVGVADLGIEINPVQFADLLAGGFSNLFRDIGESRHFFDGVDFRRETQPIPEGFEGAFAEVMFAMADVVREAALIIGVNIDDINSAIQNFVIWEEDISFKDMNLEEQEEALEAYFSSLFDSLSHAVIPYLSGLQKLGEGLGETLIRVATSIQLVELASEQMGFKWMTYIEGRWRTYEDFLFRRTRSATELVEMVGGVEEFIDAMSSFLEKFTPEAQQFEMLTQGLTDRLAEVGLVLPETREGFFDLMGTLDATTEAGREQIATLLGLVDNADAYYSYLEEAAEQAAREAERLAAEMANLYQTFFNLFASPELQEATAIATVVDAFAELGLAIPETRQGFFDLVEGIDTSTEAGMALYRTLLELAPAASDYYDILADVPEVVDEVVEAFRDFTEELGIVRQYLAEALGPPAALVSLRESFVEAMQAADALGASNKEYALIMRAFDRQLMRMAAELTKRILTLSQSLFGDAAEAAADGFESSFDQVRTVANSLFSEWQRALINIKGYADGLLLNESLTTLNPRGQFNESRSQFNDILRRARSGDVEAANALPGAAQAFLEEARFMFASGPQYAEIFREVQQALRGIQMPKGIEEYTKEIVDNTAQTVTAIESQQDATIAKLDQLLQAMDLAGALRDLGYTLERSPVDLANELGVPLDRLAEALGIDITDLSVETLMGIINMAEMLGADVLALGNTLGVDIQGLAAKFGVMLDAIDFESQFMTQNDWDSAIHGTLEKMEGWLRIIAGEGAVIPGIKDPRFKGGEMDLIIKPPKIDPSIGLTSTGETDSKLAAELAEVKSILADMRDDSQSYYKTSESQTREVVNATVETADVLRRKSA